MAAPVLIWLEVAHQGSFRIGGWAFIRKDGGGVRGTAGGTRRIDREGAELRALAAALAETPQGAVVELRTSSSTLLDLLARLAADAAAGAQMTEENQPAWTQAAAALGRVHLSPRRADRAVGNPSAFTAAWADLAADRAKAKGPFAAPIPKSNLAKAGC